MRRSILLTCAVTALTACGSDDPPGPTFAEDHPRIYLGRNRERLKAAFDANGPAAARFKRIVDLQLGGEDIYEFHGWYAALVGQLTGDPKYCEYAIRQVDAHVTSEEELVSSGMPAHVAFDSYLYVGGQVGDVMLTYDWCFDQLSESQRTRWLAYAAQAVSNVWHHEDATWGGRRYEWSGWSTENPSNNYYYSFIRATMLFGLAAHGEHPDAQAMLGFFRDDKIGGELVPTFERDLAGGGSREGTGYGQSMRRLWEIYDLWQGSTGEDLSRLTPHARESLAYVLHSVVPTRDLIAPIGDQGSPEVTDNHRNYILELGHLFPDHPLVPPAKEFLATSPVPEAQQPFMYVYDFLYELPGEPRPMDSMGRAYFTPGTGHLFARSSWATDATWFNLIAGGYSESHAHRDQGSLMIYKGGWLAYDPVIDSRTHIRQEEELHNLVRITADGRTVQQREGTMSRMVGLARGDGWLYAAADLTPAYGGNAAVQRVHREVVFLEPDCLVVFDRVATAGGTTQTWQLSAPSAPQVSGATATIDGAGHDLVVRRIAPDSANTSVYAWTSDGEFTAGHRLDTALAGGQNQLLHVLSIDAQVTSATRSDDGGRIGVTITLADGRTAVVRFAPDAIGGTLQINGGSVTTLREGVATLPL